MHVLYLFFSIQEEPLFAALVIKRFNKEFNYALMDAKKDCLVKKEYAQELEEESNATNLSN